MKVMYVKCENHRVKNQISFCESCYAIITYIKKKETKAPVMS